MNKFSVRCPIISALVVISFLGSFASAEGVSIEEVMRKFQVRYEFLKGSTVSWPSCSQDNAPAYPPDEYYQNLIDDETYTEEYLVQDIVSKFWGSSTKNQHHQ